MRNSKPFIEIIDENEYGIFGKDLIDELKHLNAVYKNTGRVITGFHRLLSDFEIRMIGYQGYDHDVKSIIIDDGITKDISVISKGEMV